MSIAVTRQIEEWHLPENVMLIANSPDARNSIEHLVRADGFLGGVMATIFAVVLLQILREIFIKKRNIRATASYWFLAVIPLIMLGVFLH